MNARTLGVAVAVASSLMLGMPSYASTVHLGVPQVAVVSSTAVSDHRYRLTNLNWDQATVVPSPFSIVQQQNLSTQAGLNGVVWDFALVHDAGVGYHFTLSNPAPSSGLPASSTTSWVAPVSVGSSTFLPTASFNAIQIYVSVASSAATYFMTATGMAFTGTGLTNAGTLSDLSASSPGVGFQNQWIVAEAGTDLSVYDWTLTGKVQGGAAIIGGNLNDQVKFDIVTAQAELAPVPLPGALGLFLSAGCVFGWLGRRRG